MPVPRASFGSSSSDLLPAVGRMSARLRSLLRSLRPYVVCGVTIINIPLGSYANRSLNSEQHIL